MRIWLVFSVTLCALQSINETVLIAGIHVTSQAPGNYSVTHYHVGF